MSNNVIACYNVVENFNVICDTATDVARPLAARLKTAAYLYHGLCAAYMSALDSRHNMLRKLSREYDIKATRAVNYYVPTKRGAGCTLTRIPIVNLDSQMIRPDIALLTKTADMVDRLSEELRHIDILCGQFYKTVQQPIIKAIYLRDKDWRIRTPEESVLASYVLIMEARERWGGCLIDHRPINVLCNCAWRHYDNMQAYAKAQRYKKFQKGDRRQPTLKLGEHACTVGRIYLPEDKQPSRKCKAERMQQLQTIRQWRVPQDVNNTVALKLWYYWTRVDSLTIQDYRAAVRRFNRIHLYRSSTDGLLNFNPDPECVYEFQLPQAFIDEGMTTIKAPVYRAVVVSSNSSVLAYYYIGRTGIVPLDNYLRHLEGIHYPLSGKPKPGEIIEGLQSRLTANNYLVNRANNYASQQQIIRKIRNRIAYALHRLPEVNLSDNYRAGNCRPGTASFLQQINIPQGITVMPAWDFARHWHEAGMPPNNNLVQALDYMLRKRDIPTG